MDVIPEPPEFLTVLEMEPVFCGPGTAERSSTFHGLAASAAQATSGGASGLLSLQQTTLHSRTWHAVQEILRTRCQRSSV